MQTMIGKTTLFLNIALTPGHYKDNKKHIHGALLINSNLWNKTIINAASKSKKDHLEDVIQMEKWGGNERGRARRRGAEV